MNKREYFIKACASEAYRWRHWCIAAYALTNEDRDAYKLNPYPYRVVRDASGVFFVDPENELKLTKIDDAKADAPLFLRAEKVTFEKGDLKNIKEKIETSYGRAIGNVIALIYAFDDKIPYINGLFTAKTIEKIVLPKLRDNPAKVEDRKADEIYVDEYLKFLDAMGTITIFTQIVVPAGTRKVLTPAPGSEKLKKELLEKNKDRLHDPAVIAAIQSELIAHDKEYMKGDLGEGLLIKSKAYNVVRSRLYGMVGGLEKLDGSGDYALITQSLYEGVDIDKFPDLNTAHRAASYNRGHETMLGGESVKWLIRASSTLNVVDKDCGTKLGKRAEITEDNYKKMVGLYMFDGTQTVLITDDNVKRLIGQKIVVRSPMYCKAGKTDYCPFCLGTRLSLHKTGLSSAVSKYGSIFLKMFLAAAHGKQLEIAVANPDTAIL